MATLVSGDTLSLNNLATATGQGTKSMSAAAGTSASPLKFSEFAIDSVGTVGGFTYVVENTGEVYTLGFNGGGSRFSRISSVSTNYTWGVTFAGANTTNYFTISSTPTDSGTLTAGDLNPEDPSAQSSILTIRQHTVSITFTDTYNDHATDYNVTKTKTIYVVDTYDGNTALCLRVDSPITLADGTILEVGDLEDGDILKGFSINGLSQDSDFNYLDWSTDNLETTPKDVTVVNVVFSFAEKMYNINDGEIIGTFEHPMLVKDSEDGIYRFKQLAQIVVGDFLIKEKENSVEEIEVFSILTEHGTEEIVSIDVEMQDTYLVNGYITHNKGGNTHTDLTGPAQVVGLAWNDGTNELTWTAVGGASAYDVQVDDVDFSWATLLVDETEWSSTLYNGEAITNGTRYARVRAIDHGLKGTWSSTLTFTQS